MFPKRSSVVSGIRSVPRRKLKPSGQSFWIGSPEVAELYPGGRSRRLSRTWTWGDMRSGCLKSCCSRRRWRLSSTTTISGWKSKTIKISLKMSFFFLVVAHSQVIEIKNLHTFESVVVTLSCYYNLSKTVLFTWVIKCCNYCERNCSDMLYLI